MNARRVLVINTGSSSIKYQLLALAGDGASGDERRLAAGSVERIGEPGAPVADHAVGMQVVLGSLGAELAAEPLTAVGHRVVHGGEDFLRPTVVDDAVLARIRALSRLAPLHNPANATGIELARRALPDVAHVAVFDTAFHVTLPRPAYLYAVPLALYERDGVRRYGFHGTSHQFVAARAAALLGRPPEDLNVITLHLGNGASACAIRAGRSVDTSMGFGPLEGLVMGTRSGDVDPTVVTYLMTELGWSAAEVERVLNRESGLLGLAGDNDVRGLLARGEAGDDHATLAIEVMTYRIKKYVGAYLAVLGRVDAIVFTGGIGEHAGAVRALALAGLEGLGIVLDGARNAAPGATARAIHADGSAVSVLVVPTDEELAIAQQTLACLGR